MNNFEPHKKVSLNEKVVATIRISLDTLDEIDKIAGKIDISRNELINQCIRYALDNIKFKEEKNTKN